MIKIIKQNVTIQRVDNEENGRYYLINDKKYYSVTTIISQLTAGMFDDAPQHLKDKWNKWAQSGTVMHRLCELYTKHLDEYKNEEESFAFVIEQGINDAELKEIAYKEFEKGYQLYVNIVNTQFFKNFKELLVSETFLWSDTYCFAGTTDCIYRDWNDSVILLDYKSINSKTIHPDKLKKYAIQLSAYRHAFQELTGITIDKCQILFSGPSGVTKCEISADKLNSYFEQFKTLNEQFKNKVL